jgi:hypothetical protein
MFIVCKKYKENAAQFPRANGLRGHAGEINCHLHKVSRKELARQDAVISKMLGEQARLLKELEFTEAFK